jgi:hypothetical protein
MTTDKNMSQAALYKSHLLALHIQKLRAFIKVTLRPLFYFSLTEKIKHDVYDRAAMNNSHP